MKKLNMALIFLAALILMLAVKDFGVASDWQQSEVTLVQGQAVVIVFNNPSDAEIILTPSAISAPPELVPYLFVSPTRIPADNSREITLKFIPLSPSDENIPPGIYALRVSGGDSDLLVSLDLSVLPPENAENRWAAIEARVDALEASLSGRIEELIIAVAALESAPPENWALEIESLRENVKLGFDGLLVWIKSELARIEASIPENSPPTDTSEWYAALGELENELREEYIDAAAQLKRDYKAQIADAKADTESNMITYGAIISAFVVAAVVLVKRGGVRKLASKIEKYKPGPPLPKDDKISPAD